MPKNIIVCFDGTWRNAANATAQSTNIDILFQSVSQQNQVANYYPGPGSNVSIFSRLTNGASGKGVFQQARLAWKFISRVHQKGDRIFIFGFSRGAFAARHLAGMIVRHGTSAYQGNIEQGFRDWLNSSDQLLKAPQGEVHFLGLFDCVPGNQLYVLRDQSKHLNSPHLEPGILHFRHAVSIHERRWSFKPLMFHPGPHHDSFSQRWFPGYHSDVGGGNNVANGLSYFSLWWMMREAYGEGLDFENMSCQLHRQAGHLMGVIERCDPHMEPVPSDTLATRMGIRWSRKNTGHDSDPDPTPRLSDLVQCTRPDCDRQMFNPFKVAFLTYKPQP